MCVQLLKYNLPILYSVIPTLRSVAMLPHTFGPPYLKILDPPLAALYIFNLFFVRKGHNNDSNQPGIYDITDENLSAVG